MSYAIVSAQRFTSSNGDELSPNGQLPEGLRARLDGVATREVVAFAEFDLDEHNRFAKRFVVLTGDELIVLDESARRWKLGQIESADRFEGVGVDRISLVVQGKPAAEMRYSRRCRREMTRFFQKLNRRLSGNGEAPATPWVEQSERQAERQDRCAKCGQLIPDYAEGVCPQCLHKRRILWRLLDSAKPYRRQTLTALLLTLLVAGLATLPPIFQKYLIDDALDPRRDGISIAVDPDVRIERLLMWSAAMLGAVVVIEVLSGWRLMLLANVGSSVGRDLRRAVYAHLHELSLRFFGKRRTGSLITRVTSDTDRLWDFIVFGSVNIIRDVLLIVAIAIVMFWLNWKLAIVALLPLPALAIITYYRSMKMQAMFGRLWTYWSRLTAVVGDALPGVRVVKAFANEDREVLRFGRRNDEYTSKEQAVNVVWAGLQPVVSGMMRLGIMLVWIVGGYLLIRHPSDRNSFGTLWAFTAFVMQFYQPIMELANSNRMVTRAATSAQRVFEVLDTPPEIYSRPGAIVKDRLQGRIEFRDVTFSYEGAQPALREISLAIEPGQMIGLCGPSGAGKSTLVNLICRFFDVSDGQILIDGLDVREYELRWLRRQIGVVLQEPYLFHGTIAENIRYGHPEASEAQIIEAARAANAHDFIVNFPDGYDTMVGERGQSLSGGERQRVSIARAILHNPRILILDEATSSVDSETEKQIQQALARLVEGRTTVAIAHRLSTLTAADRLVVLEQGQIVEQGTHAELIARSEGAYAKLHKVQAELGSLIAIRG